MCDTIITIGSSLSIWYDLVSPDTFVYFTLVSQLQSDTSVDYVHELITSELPVWTNYMYSIIHKGTEELQKRANDNWLSFPIRPNNKAVRLSLAENNPAIDRKVTNLKDLFPWYLN